MLWPERLLGSLPEVRVPAGYALRTYRDGDDEAYLALYQAAGWERGATALELPLLQGLPDGFFFAVHEARREVAGTAIAVHNPRGGHYVFPFGGELGNLVVRPDQRGSGLGRALAAAVTARLIRAGYRSIRLGTQDDRLPALRVFLALGYVPFLFTSEMEGRWQAVYDRLGRRWTPEERVVARGLAHGAERHRADRV